MAPISLSGECDGPAQGSIHVSMIALNGTVIAFAPVQVNGTTWYAELESREASASPSRVVLAQGDTVLVREHFCHINRRV